MKINLFRGGNKVLRNNDKIVQILDNNWWKLRFAGASMRFAFVYYQTVADFTCLMEDTCNENNKNKIPHHIE